MKFKVAGKIKTSTVNGEGIRYSLFLQGCKHACDGCHSPHTWKLSEGEPIEVVDIFTEMWKTRRYIDGVTISGGEPFLQPKPLLVLLKLMGAMDVNVWVWSGYKLEYLLEHFPEHMEHITTIIDGKFEKDNPTKKYWRGSDNQKRYDQVDKKWVINEK